MSYYEILRSWKVEIGTQGPIGTTGNLVLHVDAASAVEAAEEAQKTYLSVLPLKIEQAKD